MTYIEQFEIELADKIAASQDPYTLIKWVSGKLLESYKNGITAGQKGATVRKPSKVSPSQAQ